MRRALLPVMAAIAVAAVIAGVVSADTGRTNNKTFEYAIGLWGDLPYSSVQETQGLPNLFADMNAAQLAFTVHDGDLKAGSGSPCDDALYMRALGWFNSLEGAAMFTPGDNDWADCDRASNGGYNPRERLDKERAIFFSTPYSLGTHPLRQDVQTSAPLCLGATGPTPCVENRRWTFKGVTYATVNVQGSCNNLCDTPPIGDPDEYAARNAADLAWLDQTFAAAKADGSAAAMIIGQADPGFDQSDATRAPLRDPRTLAETDSAPDGYKDFLTRLRNLTIDFRRPVVYVHGDSHYFRVDKPLLDAQGRRVENFTRVETFGDNAPTGLNDVQWVKALVDPQSRDVFAFQAQIVPGNRVAVPAP